MNKVEMRKFKKVLQAAVIELDGSMRRRDAIAIEPVADFVDRTLQAAQREMAVINLEAMSMKRRDSDAALRRIQDGTYGICVECGGAVSPKRLAAIPAAALCIRCQDAKDCRDAARPVPQWFPLAA
jgi:DnaK suppressor protein